MPALDSARCGGRDSAVVIDGTADIAVEGGSALVIAALGKGPNRVRLLMVPIRARANDRNLSGIGERATYSFWLTFRPKECRPIQQGTVL